MADGQTRPSSGTISRFDDGTFSLVLSTLTRQPSYDEMTLTRQFPGVLLRSVQQSKSIAETSKKFAQISGRSFGRPNNKSPSSRHDRHSSIHGRVAPLGTTIKVNRRQVQEIRADFGGLAPLVPTIKINRHDTNFSISGRLAPRGTSIKVNCRDM
jgi:hypothetical protein